jgi:hypothetical protein
VKVFAAGSAPKQDIECLWVEINSQIVHQPEQSTDAWNEFMLAEELYGDVERLGCNSMPQSQVIEHRKETVPHCRDVDFGACVNMTMHYF